MKITYDGVADAAYIYLKYPIKAGEVKNTIALNDEIILDFDKNGKLIGIEILNAKKILAPKVLRKAVLA